MSLVKPNQGEWYIVPTEAHVEACARAGAHAVTARKLIREHARAELNSATATTPESTRLLVERVRGVSPQQAQALDQTIGKLRRAGTSAGSLARSGLERGRYFADLLSELDQILETRRLFDDRTSGWAAARRIARASSDVMLGDGPAVIRGLSSWDNGSLALVEAVDYRLRKAGCEGATLELPQLPDGPLRSAVETLASELEGRWADRQHSPSLRFVESTALAPERTTCIAAHDAESEARAVARSVLEALARGTPVDRIAIVPVDLEEAFLEPLRFELTRARIPFAEPRGRPAIASPRAHAAIELLRLARGPLNRDALIDVLRLPDLRRSAWFGDARGAVGELLHELSMLPLRFDRTGNDLTDELRDHIAGIGLEDPEHAARLGPAHAGLLRWLEELRRLAEPAARPELITRALRLFDKLGLLSVSEQTLARAIALDSRAPRRSELLLALGHDGAGARAVKTALERLSSATFAIGAESEVATLGTLLEELELALQGVSPTGGAVRAGAVRIMRPSEAASLELDLAILCRASDAALDVSSAGGSALGAELESRLPAGERPVHPLLEQRFVSLAVAWALCRADRVIVTWATHEAMRSLAPSRLAEFLIRAGADTRREPASPLVPGARPANARRVPSEGARQRIQIERRRSAFYADPLAAPDQYSGDVGSLAAFLSGSAERPISVTALERALRCSFLGFTGTVLRATVVDPVEDAISARERGNLLHAALAAGLESIRDVWGRRSIDELESIALESARSLIEQRGRSPLRRAGLQSSLTDVACMLHYMLREDDGFRFHLAEQAFGMEGGWSPLSLADRFVAGRTDRIDLSLDGKRLRVIDYKTRMPTRADQERALQPALYAAKAARELGAEHVEFAYVALQGRSPAARTVFSAPADSEQVREGVQRALAILAELEAGRVAPRPASSSHCARCSARDICRRPLSAPEAPES